MSDIKVYSHLNNVYIKNETNVALQAVEIIDITGQVIYKSAVNNVETIIPLQVANGIYYIKLISQEQTILVKKVIITYN
jgi:hypothetical protein